MTTAKRSDANKPQKAYKGLEEQHTFLLSRLGAHCSRPAQDDGVSGVSSNSEDHHRDVATSRVESCWCDNETNDCHGLADG